MTGHAAIGVDNDFAARKPTVTHGTADHELSSRVDEIPGVVVGHVGDHLRELGAGAVEVLANEGAGVGGVGLVVARGVEVVGPGHRHAEHLLGPESERRQMCGHRRVDAAREQAQRLAQRADRQAAGALQAVDDFLEDRFADFGPYEDAMTTRSDTVFHSLLSPLLNLGLLTPGEVLEKVLAHAGVASRRKCEEIILDGRVRVNGNVVKALGVAHKTEIKGVRLNLRDSNEVSKAVREMSGLSESYLVEKMVAGVVAELGWEDTIVRELNLSDVLLNGVLCFMLFAGSAGVEFKSLQRDKWTIASLAIGATLIACVLTGWLLSLTLGWLGVTLAFSYALVFGALISPTDPIAALAILKAAGLPKRLEAIINGESLFNDGVGVVLFTVSLAYAQGSGQERSPVALFLREVVGAAGAGVDIVVGLVEIGIDLRQGKFLSLRADRGRAPGWPPGSPLHLAGGRPRRRIRPFRGHGQVLLHRSRH